MKLQIEVNAKAIPQAPSFEAGNRVLMVTPPIDEEFWLMRVPVSDSQAIVCFPKFTTIGIGFQKEYTDWNTNLPYTIDADDLFKHIAVNKGDASIPDTRCIEAIKLLQTEIKTLRK